MVNSQASGVPPAPRSCAGCGGKIADRFLLFSMERYWHTRCLKCSCCQAQLGDIGTTCYSKGGMILCRSDYIRLFGHSGACSACGQSIPANEMVMRAQGNVYHLKCFSCATCRNRLMPGDRFHYINGTIFCEHDRPGRCLAQQPPASTSEQLCADRPEGMLSVESAAWCARLSSRASLLSGALFFCRYCCRHCGFPSPSRLSSLERMQFLTKTSRPSPCQRLNIPYTKSHLCCVQC